MFAIPWNKFNPACKITIGIVGSVEKGEISGSETIQEVLNFFFVE